MCTKQRSAAGENGCECWVVTADSVAMRVWPMAWYPVRDLMPYRSQISLGEPTSLKTSSDSPQLTRSNSGAPGAEAGDKSIGVAAADDRTASVPDQTHLGVEQIARARPVVAQSPENGGSTWWLPGTGVVIDGNTGRIGPAIGHGLEHLAREHSQFAPQCRCSWRCNPIMPHIAGDAPRSCLCILPEVEGEEPWREEEIDTFRGERTDRLSRFEPRSPMEV